MDSHAVKAGRREWIGLAVIALPCMLYSMDLTVLNLALPALSADLAPSASQLLWIVDIYGFMVAGMLITMGTLGDRIGRRRLLMIGAAAFGAASLLAAFSNSAEMLIAMRALLGIAGATLAPSTLSLIRNMFHDPAQRTTAIGVWISAYSVGAAIGPVIGGVLLEYFWWGSVFLINAPVMVLLLAVAPTLLPEFRDPAARRLDLTSVLLSLSAVLATIYGIKRFAEHGASLAPALFVTGGLAVGYLFVRRQGRLDEPLIELALFRTPAFSAALTLYLFSCLVMFGVYIFIAQYLQGVLALSPLQAGLATVPWGLFFVLGSMLTPRAVQASSTRTVIVAGLALGAAGFALITQADEQQGLVVMILAMTLMSIGLAPVFTLATDLVVGSVPAQRAGSASAISETCSEFGGALGVAIFGSVGALIYRVAMVDALPAGLSPEIVAAARTTLGGASAVAADLPLAQGAALLESARSAFVQGLHVTAVIGAVVMALLSLAAAKLLAPETPPPAAVTAGTEKA